MEELRIKKVSIEMLMALLTNLYDKGVDYVDISNKSEDNDEEDTLGVSFCREYMNPELEDNFDEFEEEILSNEDIDVHLSDDDLNKLA